MPWEKEIPGIGLVITLVLIFGIGVFAANVVGRRIIEIVEDLIFVRIPLLGSIYRSVKQMIDAFSISNNKGFKQVVLVEWPKEGFYSIAFLTNDQPERLKEYIGKDVVTLLPTAPNVTTGFFITLKHQLVTPIDLSVEDAFKTIISSGVFAPPSAMAQAGEQPEKKLER